MKTKTTIPGSVHDASVAVNIASLAKIHMESADTRSAADKALSAHAKIRCLSWEIADLLNGLDPRIEYVMIQASCVGAHAVMTGFDIPMPDDNSIETLFQQWREAEQRAEAADGDEGDEGEEPQFIDYRDLQSRIAGCIPKTARELAIMMLVGTDRWASAMTADLKALVKTLGAEGEA